MLRIHFTSTDLSRTVIAPGPDPMWETLLSLHMVQTRDGKRSFDAWRRPLRNDPPVSLRPLLALTPPVGYSPDFLTPPIPCTSIDAGLDALAYTSPARLRADLEVMGGDRRLPTWSTDLARGRTDVLKRLTGALRGYYDHALAPHWDTIGRTVEADRTQRGRTVLEGGVDRLLATLNPALRWQAPVLEIPSRRHNRDIHLDGRGLRLIPSYFCWGAPTLLRDPELPPVLVYPVDHGTEPSWSAGGAGPRSDAALDALLGRTRARVLRTVAYRGCTTTQVARSVGVSAATASQHLSVLRETGLVTTLRYGASAHHASTSLGDTMCGL